jgi:hypothetical protein
MSLRNPRRNGKPSLGLGFDVINVINVINTQPLCADEARNKEASR